MCCVEKDNNKLKGEIIKMTASHSAAGQSAPSCATASYLQESELVMTEEEFKKDEGSFMIKTHVLPKNGGTGPADQGFGRTVLVCDTKHKKILKRDISKSQKLLQ